MIKILREDINRVKKLEKFLNESLIGKLSFLVGKPISLIKTLHTIGKWNDEKNEMDKITKSEEFDGFIGEISEIDGIEVAGFGVMNEDGSKKGFVLYDKESGEFVEGMSSYNYTYQGKTEKDDRILQLVVDNL